MALLYTNGFNTEDDLLDHFDKHVTQHNNFLVSTADEYQALADKFLGEPLDTTTTLQCFRQKNNGTNGDMIRYNRNTQEFGILSELNYIRTYYKPSPSRHKHRTNEGYFNSECKKASK